MHRIEEFCVWFCHIFGCRSMCDSFTSNHWGESFAYPPAVWDDPRLLGTLRPPQSNGGKAGGFFRVTQPQNIPFNLVIKCRPCGPSHVCVLLSSGCWKCSLTPAHTSYLSTRYRSQRRHEGDPRASWEVGQHAHWSWTIPCHFENHSRFDLLLIISSCWWKMNQT